MQNEPRRATSRRQALFVLSLLALLLILLRPRSAPGLPQITPQNIDRLHETLRLESGSGGSPARQTSLSPDRDMLLVTTGYNIDLWRLDQATKRSMSLLDAGGYTPLVFFSAGRPLAAFQDWRTTLSFLDMETGALIRRFTMNSSATFPTEWNLSPNNRSLVYRDGELELVAADLWTGDEQFRIGAPLPYNFRRPNPTFSSDGMLLATSLIDDNVGNGIIFGSFIWDGATGRLVRQLGDFPANGFVDALAFSHDKKLLAVAGGIYIDGYRNGFLQLWDLETGRTLTSQFVDALSAQELVFTHDDRSFVARSRSGIWLWRVDSLLEASEPILRLEGVNRGTEYTAMTLNAEDTLLGVGTSEGAILLYTVESEQLLKTLTGHRNRINALAFSDDGRLLISSGNDATVRFWTVGEYAPPMFSQPEVALPTPIMTPTVPFVPSDA